MAMNYNNTNPLVPPMSGMGSSMNVMSNSNPFGIQPGTMSTTMPNPMGMMGGKMREIIIDRNQQPWKNYIPYIDADIPIELDCKQLLEIFKKENARILASNPYPDILYPCENMMPGESVKVTVKNLWDGRKAYSKEFIFTLDANRNCICEEVKSGGGGTKKGRRAKDMELFVEEDMWNFRNYGDIINRTGSDMNKPSCEHFKAYFKRINLLLKDKGREPIYPCDSFKNGETEQYITYRIRPGGVPTYYRFYIDANGNCQCEIVNKIPTDYTDRGSGPTGGPIDMGQGGMVGGVMGGTGGVEYADSALSAYTNNNLNMKIVQGPMSSVIDLSNNPTSVRILNEKEKIKSIQPSSVPSVSSKYNSLYNRVTNNIVNNPESFQNSLFSQQTQFLTNNAVLGNDVYTQMLRESRVLPERLTNTFAPLPTRFSQAQNIDMTTQMYGAREPYSPVNQFSNLNISTYPQTNQLSETNQTISYPMNSFGTISPANYYTSPQSITGGSYTSVPVNSYHRR